MITEMQAASVDNIALVPLDRIVDPPYQEAHNAFNPFDPSAAQDVANSVLRDGLLHPITLLQVPGTDRYWRLAGRHRVEAYRQLGRTEIEAKVYDGISLVQAEIITLMENLVRHNLSGPTREGDTAKSVQIRAGIHRDRALKRAHELYNIANPAAAVKEKAAREMRVEGKPYSPPANTPDVKTFVEATAEATGQHPQSIRKQLKRAEGLTNEETEVLIAKEVPLNDQSRFASLPAEAKSRAIEVLKNNGTVEEAYAIATVPKDAPARPDAPQAHREETTPDELSDADWLDQYEFKDRVVWSYYCFYALLWRRTAKAREQLVVSIQREVPRLQKEYGGVQHGPRSLLANYNRTVGYEHPHLWKVCGACEGHGILKPDTVDMPGQATTAKVKTCKDCDGGGFIMGQAARIKKAAPPKEKPEPAPKAAPKAKPKAAPKARPNPRTAAQKSEPEPADIETAPEYENQAEAVEVTT